MVGLKSRRRQSIFEIIFELFWGNAIFSKLALSCLYMSLKTERIQWFIIIYNIIIVRHDDAWCMMHDLQGNIAPSLRTAPCHQKAIRRGWVGFIDPDYCTLHLPYPQFEGLIDWFILFISWQLIFKKKFSFTFFTFSTILLAEQNIVPDTIKSRWTTHNTAAPPFP